MMRSAIAGAVAVLGVLMASTGALADDWQAVKLRGSVVELIGGTWTPVTRDELVPDSRVIRTMGNGHVTFVRGQESVDLGPDTQIQIFDKGTGKPFTTVKQYFGTVAVEAEVENVQHFAVDTPFLAAVVKGTRFVVTAEKTGGSVAVDRGHVQVTDKLDKTQVTISIGQSAALDTKAGGKLRVSGHGRLPAVVDKDGEPVTTGTPSDTNTSGDSTSGDSSSAPNGGSSGGGDGVSVNVEGGKGSSGGSAVSVSVGKSSSNSSTVSATVGNSSGNAAVDVGTKGKLVDVKVGGLLHLHL